MAETTGKNAPATDPKSGSGKGPVRPPVLEGTARPAGSGKAGATATGEKAASGAAEKPAAARPATAPRAEDGKGNGGGAWLAGIVGGVVGLGAAYGLAWYGLWPAPPQPPVPADPRLAQFASAIPELETVTGTVQDELSVLTSRVAALETAEPPAAAAPAADPQLAEELASLAARVEELAAESSAPAETGALAALEAELAALREEAEGTAAQLAQAQQQIATLSQSADESAGAEAATVRLPLIFSGLESAFAAGRPFETELAALRQALPEVLVPEAIAGRAASGLPRPDEVGRRLEAVLPDMLAGRPAAADAGWQDSAADWFRGLVAMRPAGDVEGDGPDARIARLEAAVARRDFVAAEAELSALPAPMREAAGEVAGDVASLAAAERFLAELRQAVLSGEAGA